MAYIISNRLSYATQQAQEVPHGLFCNKLAIGGERHRCRHSARFRGRCSRSPTSSSSPFGRPSLPKSRSRLDTLAYFVVENAASGWPMGTQHQILQPKHTIRRWPTNLSPLRLMPKLAMETTPPKHRARHSPSQLSNGQPRIMLCALLTRASVCWGEKATYRMTSENIDTHIHLGINAEKRQRARPSSKNVNPAKVLMLQASVPMATRSWIISMGALAALRITPIDTTAIHISTILPG